MNRVSKYFLSILILFTSLSVRGQVTDVSFRILYDTATCRYNMMMKVLSGSTTGGVGQAASTAQFTIVVPTGMKVTNIVSNEPRSGSLVSGTVVRSATVTQWSAANTLVNDPALAGYDIIGFTPALNNSYFPPLIVNDEIMLFSVEIKDTVCRSGIRMWKNNEVQGVTVTGGDPTAFQLSTGSDYNNGTGIGSPAQIYNSNGTSSTTPPIPVVVSVTPACTSTTFSLSANVKPGSVCAGTNLTYTWTGPGAFSTSSSIPSFTITTPTSANSGTYVLTVTDNNNCKVNFGKGYNAITCNILPLPIKLTSFIGIADKCMASFVWTTNSLANFKEYEIQYSRDAKSFETVGKISAAPNKDNRYTFEYPQSSGKGYYRLKVVDQNGSDTYSETITVVTNCLESAIKIFPNPATSVVHIQGIEAGDEVKVMDALGQVVTSAKSPGNIATLDLTAYAPGVYSVMIAKGAAMTKAGTVVKQ